MSKEEDNSETDTSQATCVVTVKKKNVYACRFLNKERNNSKKLSIENLVELIL